MERLRRGFLLSGMVLILVSAVAKLITLPGKPGWFALPDPVLPVFSNKTMTVLALALEVLVYLSLTVARRSSVRLVIVAWFATILLSYRLALHSLGYKGPCACMGAPGLLEGVISLEAQNTWLWGIVWYLIAGSYGLLTVSLALSRSSSFADCVKPRRRHKVGATFVRTALVLFVTLGTKNAGRAEDRTVRNHPFEVQGVISTEMLENDHLEARPKLFFRMRVDANRWDLRLTPPDAVHYDFKEVTSDGHTIRYLTCFTSRVQRAQARGELVGINGCTGGAFEGQIPHLPFVHQAGPLWLAFASGAYLQSRTNVWLEPVITFGVPSGIYDSRNRYLQQAHWTSGTNTGLPTSMVYFAAGYERHRSLPNVKVRLPQPFAKGYTNAVYTTGVWLDNGNVRVPQSADLVTYGLKYSPNTGTPTRTALLSRYHIEVSSVRKVAANAILEEPVIPAVAVITETRCDGIDFSYWCRNGRWLTPVEARKTPDYRAAAGVHAQRRSVSGVFVTTCVLVTLAFPSAWLLVTRKQQRRANQKEPLL